MIKKLYSRAYDLLDEVNLIRESCDKVIDTAHEHGYKIIVTDETDGFAKTITDNTDDNIYYARKLNDILSRVEYDLKKLIIAVDTEIPTESLEEKDFIEALEEAYEEI